MNECKIYNYDCSDLIMDDRNYYKLGNKDEDCSGGLCEYFDYALSFLPRSRNKNVLDFKNGITNKQISTPEKIVYDLYRKGFSVYKNEFAYNDKDFGLNCSKGTIKEEPKTEESQKGGGGISVISVKQSGGLRRG